MSSKEKEKLFSVAKKLKEKTNNDNENLEFKIVVTGKGGVGKTTTSAILSHLFAKDGYNVLAIDEDPQMNLPYSLGLDEKKASKIIPLSHNLDYIEEKTGARPGTSWGLFLSLTPDVKDVVEKFGVKVNDKISVFVMGTVVQAATGCLCPENALLDAVIRYISLRKNEIIIMDTQAGVEHFGRALAKGFRHCVVVTDYTFNAIEVAKHTAKLAQQIGIPNIYLLVNKIRKERDIEKANEYLQSCNGLFKEVFFGKHSDYILDNEPFVTPVIDVNDEYIITLQKLKTTLQRNNIN
ncbi:carbon monoxide dehydrogenase [Deferribacter autotrophicus]|uniref:Carbon monoxide dehydrogenase n=1 Tax=Deferribacter autotrophicus TaxID=500465 RepID=A0A5A8F4V2_9BACT|nr:AAA family ATPase [Deferribacter autotrophicus]KAA0256848.1 carbon monoxide dehydrogenase [Deferribacter autotrophicus]